MNLSPEQRERLLAWVEDLESGNHRQARSILRRLSSGGSDSYCCLGRLCEVAIADGVELYSRPETLQSTAYGYANTTIYLANAHTSKVPDRVAAWLGFPATRFQKYAQKYAQMNDVGHSFLQIAAAIREDFDLGPRDA